MLSTTSILVCNEGVPACIMYGEFFEKPISEIHDDDIMNPDLYPMSYEDAMELEIMDAFNYEMKRLTELEEFEELHRRLESRIEATIEAVHNNSEMAKHDRKLRDAAQLRSLIASTRGNRTNSKHGNYRKPRIVLHQPRQGREHSRQKSM